MTYNTPTRATVEDNTNNSPLYDLRHAHQDNDDAGYDHEVMHGPHRHLHPLVDWKERETR